MKKYSQLFLLLLLSATLISAQSKFGIGVNAGIQIPTGDFADAYKNGFGAGAALSYDLSDNLQLAANVGYSQFSFNNDKYNELLNEFFGAFGTKMNVDIQSKLKVIPLMLSGKYFLTSSAVKPYAQVELGLHIVSVDASTVKVNSETITAVSSQSEAATAWGIGFGVLYNAAPKIDIDINAKIGGNSLEMKTSMSTSTSNSSASQTSNSTMSFFAVTAGIHFAL